MKEFNEENDFIPIIGNEEKNIDASIYNHDVPVVPLRNTVLFPGVSLPISVGRKATSLAIRKAYKKDKLIAVLTQLDQEEDDPGFNDLYQVGTLARILKIIEMPDGGSTAILQGLEKIRYKNKVSTEPFLEANFTKAEEIYPKQNKEFKALMSNINDVSLEIIDKSNQIPNEAAAVLKNIKNKIYLINFIASNLSISTSKKQEVLNMDDLNARAIRVLELLNTELQMVDLKNKIQDKTRNDIEKQQRDYFLNQQLRTIQEELGQNSPAQELEVFKQRAAKMKWPKKVAESFDKEYNKLLRTNPATPEYSLTLNHLEFLLDLPWGITTKDNLDLSKAKKVLDKEHYGLDKIKERLLEYLAVLKLKGDLKSPILCFIGPPGVGKTSLGKSIASALGRKYVRMSLGGLHDESEIRGHRKTYIGAMPGRIIQSLKKTKSSNPVFILDEIDKVGNSFRGDPSSALLEVLDPEQNSTFYDNYLETEFDLSKVLFIATANSYSEIQPALRDRMEIIDLSGYSIEEKIQIAKKHLIPQQREAHGLKAKDIQVPNETLKAMVEQYTAESGVRSLDRTVASLMRSIAKLVSLNEEYNAKISVNDLETYLGPQKIPSKKNIETLPPGVAVGLAYTAIGGDVLFIESIKYKGKEELKLTGNLGDVMKESANTALSFIKSKADVLNIPEEAFKDMTTHLHFPAGATPKDGPSAGITILSALASLYTNRPLKKYLAMTGEISLRGKVLPVGGIKEKVLAAKRRGIKDIILSKENEKDVKEINPSYIQGLTFLYVNDMTEVLQLALAK